MHDPYELVRLAKIQLMDSHDRDEAEAKVKEKYPDIPNNAIQNALHIATNEWQVESNRSPSGFASIMLQLYDLDKDATRAALKEEGLCENDEQIEDAIHVAEAEIKRRSKSVQNKPKVLERHALDILILSGGIESQARSATKNLYPFTDDDIIERAVRAAMARYPRDMASRMKENPSLLIDYTRHLMRDGRDDVIKKIRERYPHLDYEEIKDAIITVGSEMYG